MRAALYNSSTYESRMFWDEDVFVYVLTPEALPHMTMPHADVAALSFTYDVGTVDIMVVRTSMSKMTPGLMEFSIGIRLRNVLYGPIFINILSVEHNTPDNKECFIRELKATADKISCAPFQLPTCSAQREV